MSARLNPFEAAPAGIKAMQDVEAYLAQCGLERRLLELVKMRASQINGCAFCLHMHSQDARAAGEREERLYLLSGWRESSLYSERERAALAWTEALTRVAEEGAPDREYEALVPQFTTSEIANLTLAIAVINAWNRIAIGINSQHPENWSAAAHAASETAAA